MGKSEVNTKKKKNSLPDIPEHHYFKGHLCNIPSDKQTKYAKNEKRRHLNYLVAIRSGDIRARYMFRSYAALSAEKYRQYTQFPYSIHPYSRLRMVWDVFLVFVLQTSIFVIAYYYMETERNMKLERTIHVFECIYLINVIMNFFTGYVEGHSARVIVLSLKSIAWKYLKTWLIIDLLFCAGILLMFAGPAWNVKWDVIMTTPKCLITLRLLHYVCCVMEMFGATEVPKTLVNISLIIINYLMWNMYFQFSLEYLVNSDRSHSRSCSWLAITQMWNASDVVRKISSFNRAVGMLQQNSNMNVIEEHGCFEMFFVISWRVGKIVIIYCGIKFLIMSIGTESAKSKYFTMIRQLQLYMNERRFPNRIKKKILKYFYVRYQSHFFMEYRMMDCVSGRLREDIIMHTSRQLVGETELLKHLPRSLLLQISIKLKVVIFLAGDIIFKINTIGDCLYFIDKGTVAIYSESGKEICHLEDGDFFGEISLVIQPRFRTSSAVAATNCELLRLDKKDFESTIAIYPTVYEYIRKIAYQRLDKTIVLDEKHKAEMTAENETTEDEK